MPTETSATEAAEHADHPLAVALRLLRTDAPEQTDDPQAWPRWAALLPHVLAATALLDSAVGPSAWALLANASWLLDLAGNYLRVHARLTDARPLLERALAIDEAAYGPGHPSVADDLNNLAATLRDLGEPVQAQALEERAAAIKQVAGPDKPGAAGGAGET
jgi:tetratricopeptide (TPR) repeat protein